MSRGGAMPVYVLHGGHGGGAVVDNLLALLPILVIGIVVAGARLRAWRRRGADRREQAGDWRGDEPI